VKFSGTASAIPFGIVKVPAQVTFAAATPDSKQVPARYAARIIMVVPRAKLRETTGVKVCGQKYKFISSLTVSNFNVIFRGLPPLNLTVLLQPGTHWSGSS
jgi:hypothetical protein